MEADTRYIIDNNLRNKGWIIDSSDPSCNVHLESPKDEQLRKRLKGKHPDYILYESNTKRPIGVIEAKKGGVDLQKALEQGEKYAKELDAPLIFAMNGAYCETRFLRNKKPLILNGEEVKELLREKEALEFLKKDSNEVYTLPKNVVISRQELIRVFKDLNNTLRAEGLRAGIERLSEFANILFLKLLSENGKQDYWTSIKKQDDSDILGFINGYVIEQIQKEYGGDVFTKLLIENPKTIREIINRLDPLVLSTIDTDIKGDAFEYFLQKTTSTDNDLGEYFTPRHIVKTMVNLVNPVFGEKVYDPFCGTGGFLTEAFKYIKENAIIDENGEDILKTKTIFGGELTTTARIAKMNMILQGDGHSGVFKINSLANPKDKKYDIVISNIPFSQKKPPTELYYNGLGKNNGDAVCVLHCLRALKDGGRMALIVPEGFLANKNLASVRKFLLDNAKLQAVISLPRSVFLPYTPVKTDILYFTDVRIKRTANHFFYFDVKNDGYSLDAKRQKLDGGNDLRTINSSNVMKDSEEEILSIGFDLIQLDKIKDNSYNLVGSSYLNKSHGHRKGFVTLGSLIDEATIVVRKGQTITKKTATAGQYPVIAAGQSSPYTHDKFNYKKNIITMSSSGAYAGFIWYHNAPIWASDCSVIYSQDANKLLTKFLYLILKSKQDYIYGLQRGAGQPHVYIDDIRHIDIPLLSLKQQNKIIKITEEEEKKIAMNKKMIEKASRKIEEKLDSLWG